MINQKKKVLRVITQAEVVPWHLKNFIDRSQDDFEIYITGNNVTRYKSEYPHVTFIDNEIIRKISLLKDISALIKLIITIIRVKPVIIHSIMPKAGLLASIAGWLTFVPIRIHTYTGQVWATKKGFTRNFFKAFDKLILRFCTHCFTDSPSQSIFLAQNGIRFKGKVIPHLGKGSLSGVSLNRFNSGILKERDTLRSQLNIDVKDFVFIYLARKTVVKGINELFESFEKIAHLPNVRLLFIGPDESEGRLTELYDIYKNISDKIVSINMVKDHEIYLAAADVLCIPSSSEGFGTIVIESAALGVPSIGFNIVGLSDSIENNQTGILVPFKNTDKFADAMLDLYDDKIKLNSMKLKAVERATQYFSADLLYVLQKDVYNTLINCLSKK